jgi:pimeloyl-ACP methyl ester carboxylesterase
MTDKIQKEGNFTFIEHGEGRPLIILHGLMGGLSNFDGVLNHFSAKGYQVVLPELPIYSLNILKTNVKSFPSY